MSILQQPQNHLCSLPRELRDAIYGYVVESPTPIPCRINLRDVEVLRDIEVLPLDTAVTAIETTTQVKISPQQPALAQTDRETRSEVLQLFYAKNTFLFRTHALDLCPLRTWLQATAEADYYAQSAALMQHVAIERNVRKTCQQSPPSARQRQQHTYRIAISLRPNSSDPHVRFEADLADECACALQSAVKIKPRYSCSVMHTSVNAAFSFAADVENDLSTGLGGLGLECNSMFGLCGSNVGGGEAANKCEDCGKRISRKERVGSRLLGLYETLASREPEREG